jgi:hypothetical protein
MSDTKNITDMDFVNGVQSISVNNNFDTISFTDIGRDRKNDFTYLQPQNEISVQRITSNLDDLFSVVLNSEPSSYGDGLFLKPTNFGHSITGDPQTDLKQFDLTLVYGSSLEQTIGNNLLDVLTYKRCLLTNLSISMSVSEPFTQDLTFINKIVDKPEIDIPIDFSELPLNPEVSTRKDFDRFNSILPTELIDNVNFGAMKDGEGIYGIQNISVNLGLNYTEHADNGLWHGSVEGSENNVNQWVSIQLPLTVTASFTIKAQRGHQFNIDNSNKNFSKSQIRLVNRFIDPNTFILKYYVIDLGVNNILKSFSSNSGSVDGSILEYTLEYENTTNDFSVYVKEDLDFSNQEGGYSALFSTPGNSQYVLFI